MRLGGRVEGERPGRRSVFGTISGAPLPVELDLAPKAASGATLAHFEDLGLIGSGGMGEVHRVRDPDLKRVMALKILRAPLLQEPNALARFVAEAQATAQLTHPGIVPVHEFGRLEDGRLWFTMREVKGRTLGEVIDEVHRASTGDRWQISSSGWTFRELVDRFHDACEAVAYAHHRAVVHRDLKPDNIMVGAYGEVLVLDWGLAKVRGQPLDDAVVTARSEDDAHRTRMGTVAGTPAYMPPEQARGDVDAIDSRSDVYALGAILYEILSGRAPYEGSSWRAVIRQVLAFPPEPPGRVVGHADTFTFAADAPEPEAAVGPPLPRELVDACNKAMSRNPADRHEDAGALGQDVAAWLAGSRRQEQALALVAEADQVVEEAIRLRSRAAQAQDRAKSMLDRLSPIAAEQEKSEAWAREDAAVEADHKADVLLVQREKLLHAALVTHPDLPEAHARLAWVYRHASQAAERAGNPVHALRDRELFHSHALALPEDDPDRAAHLAWLRGDGAVTLITEPAGVEVLLTTMVRQGRRLVAEPRGSLGRTPLIRVPVPMGSHVLHLLGPHGVVRYPVAIARAQHWDGVGPNTDGRFDPEGPATVIPLIGPVPDDAIYVPPGWFRAGDRDAVDDNLMDSGTRRPTRLWLDGYLIHRHPVTSGAYAHFLADLDEDEATRHLPEPDHNGRACVERDADGGLRCDRPEVPVTGVSYASALAYADWVGDGWRLVSELEREKAARGVDGRRYPWGDVWDPSFAANQLHDLRAPARVDAFPVDVSVYGVCGLAGNTSDWCLGNAWNDERTQSVQVNPPFDMVQPVRGGEYSATEWEAQAALGRRDLGRGVPRPERGLRLARSLSAALDPTSAMRSAP